MLIDYIILYSLVSIAVHCCKSRNSLISNSYNVQNQPNIIPLGLLFNGSSLQFSINNSTTQNNQIYQSIDQLNQYNSNLNTQQMLSMSQFPTIVGAQLQIQLIMLSQNNSDYYVFSTYWVDNQLKLPYSNILQISNQQSCNRITHLSQDTFVILCYGNLLIYNQTQSDLNIIAINWPTFQTNFTWLKTINSNTIYVSFSDGISNFLSLEFAYANGQCKQVNSITTTGIVTGFEIFAEQTYFILKNNQLLYVEKSTTFQINVDIYYQSYLSVFQGLNKLGQVHFYIAIINQFYLTQFIFSMDTQSTSFQFTQQFERITINSQPTLFLDQYYLVMQLNNELFGFVGYENQDINITPLIYQLLTPNSTIFYLTYSDQIVIQSPSNSTLNQINQPILVFEKPQKPLGPNEVFQFNYTIYVTSSQTKESCYQNFTQQTISNNFNEITPYQNCSQINIQLYNPEIKAIDIGYCGLGPNITYQAGTYVALDTLNFDYTIGSFNGQVSVINEEEIELFFQELAIYQINSIYTFLSSPREFTYFTYLINPLNSNQYIQLIQYNDFQVDYQICDKWVCQNTTIIQFHYELTMSQIGVDITKKTNNILLITNAQTPYELNLFELNQTSLINSSSLNISQSLNVSDALTISQIMLSGPYLYVITQNPNQLVIYNIYNFQLIPVDVKDLQPRKLEQNYHSYGDNIFLDNTINLIIFEMVDGQFTIAATIPYPADSTSVAIGLLNDGVYIALDDDGQSELYYYSRQLLFQSIINEKLIVQIPTYGGQFIQPMVSAFSEQFFYIQMLMPDETIQLCIFKTDYNLLYLSYYFQEQFNSISVIQVETVQNYDLIGFQSPSQFTILQNYWHVAVILNSEFLVPGIQFLDNTQIILMCSNNYLNDYWFSFPVSVNNSYYQISRTQQQYPIVNQTKTNFTVLVNPLEYFTGSMISFSVQSRGKNIAIITTNIIDSYLEFSEQINSVAYSKNLGIIYTLNNQQIGQFDIENNSSSPVYIFNINQYTKCVYIFIEYTQQSPVAVCTNNTDTYVYLNAGKQIYSLQQLTGYQQPNLRTGFYEGYVLILGFNQSPYSDCVNINSYYVTWDIYFNMILIEETENCVYQLFTFTMLNINTNPNNITADQCFGWIGITDDISTFPFHYGCYNFSQITTGYVAIQYTPKQLFIQSLLSNSIELVQISQIGLPNVTNNYSEITLLFSSQNNAYSFNIQIYETSVILLDNLLIFQQFSNQKAIQTVSNYNQEGNLNVITMFLQQVGSQIFQTLCIYQPFNFDNKLKIVEFLYCKTLHTFVPSNKKYTPYLYFITGSLVLTNNQLLSVGSSITITIYAFPHTESYVYLEASNFDSTQNVTINLIQTDLERSYTGWVIFSLLIVATIFIIMGYSLIKKLRNDTTDTERYIEL